MRGWGWSLLAARPVCAASPTAPWFHATITNKSAPATYVRCAFTAWDKNGQQVLFGYLPLAVMAFPAGMHLERQQTRSIDWFFDAQTFPEAARHTHDVTRYTAICTPWKNPPI
jgi:hypothetical protein